jgi:hypothetical protein
MTLLPLILCEKSIARIPEAWKRFLDPENFKNFPKNSKILTSRQFS